MDGHSNKEKKGKEQTVFFPMYQYRYFLHQVSIIAAMLCYQAAA